MTLADLIHAQQEALTGRWLDEVRPLAPRGDLPPEALVDSLPRFLAELMRALRQLEDPAVCSALPQRSPVAEAHGGQRHALGYTAGAVAREYALLHEALLRLAQEAGVPVAPRESLLLARCMGTATAEALSPFSTTARAQADAPHAERQRLESLTARLQESEEQLRRVVEATGTGTYEVDIASGAISPDARHRALVGLPPEGPLDVGSALEVTDPRDRGHVSAALTAAFAGERGGRYLVEHRTVGTAWAPPRWVEARGQVMFDAEGKPARLLGTGVDVTARKEAEVERERLLREHQRAREAAEATSAELEAIFQSLPDAVYVGSPTGIHRANAPALDMLGYTDLAALNRDIGTLAAEIQTRRVDTGEFIPVEGQAFTHALQGRADVQEVLVRHLGTGEDRVVRASCAPIRVGGAVVGAVAINSDITERMRTEAALRARVDFEQQLVGIVSHDLRNPLQAILLSAQSLLRDEGLESRASRALLRVRSSAERALRLVRDLLDFTQARVGGGIPVELRSVDLHALVRGVVEELEVAHPERTLRLRSEGPGEGRWDADRLAQVVENLVSNALKYSREASAVEVTTRGEPESLLLEVHNEGAPIPPHLLPHIFEPLQRAVAGTDAQGRSVGLGLYIVKHLVEAHGGTIEVWSAEQEGTTFRVRLPRGG